MSDQSSPTSDVTALRCPRCDSPSPELHPAVQFEGEVQPCADPWHDRARIPVGYRKINGHLVRTAPTSDATALDRLIEHLDMIRELVWECAPKCKDDLMAHLTTAIKRTRDIRGAVPPVPVEGLDWMDGVLDCFNRWKATLPVTAFTHSDGASFVQMLNELRARLAAVEGAKK